MREVILSKEGSLKLSRGSSSLYFSDIETSIKSCIPGEWIILFNTKHKIKYYAFVNPLAKNNAPCIHRVELPFRPEYKKNDILKICLTRAIEKRNVLDGYQSNSRLFFGNSDGLPGLIIDTYENCNIVQINSAGMDSLREDIKSLLAEISSKETIFLDNKSYREMEGLPIYETEPVSITKIKIKENELKFEVAMDELQKVGFYFDHRENRLKLKSFLSRMKKKPKKGLDLFSYVGAWGLTMLQSGLETVTFVDQGNFQEIIKDNLSLNGLNESPFIRSDVFSFLKECQNEGKTFDLICSDPPAFCKSQKEKRKAIEGYTRLHSECFKVLEDKSLFVAASCTHYVSLEELIETVNRAALKNQKKITLVDIGGQGIDHPTSTLTSSSNYLKYTLFYVENL